MWCVAATRVVIFGHLQVIRAQTGVAGRAFRNVWGDDAEMRAATVVVSTLVFGNCRKHNCKYSVMSYDYHIICTQRGIFTRIQDILGVDKSSK